MIRVSVTVKLLGELSHLHRIGLMGDLNLKKDTFVNKEKKYLFLFYGSIYDLVHVVFTKKWHRWVYSQNFSFSFEKMQLQLTVC